MRSRACDTGDWRGVDLGASSADAGAGAASQDPRARVSLEDHRWRRRNNLEDDWITVRDCTARRATRIQQSTPPLEEIAQRGKFCFDELRFNGGLVAASHSNECVLGLGCGWVGERGILNGRDFLLVYLR